MQTEIFKKLGNGRVVKQLTPAQEKYVKNNSKKYSVSQLATTCNVSYHVMKRFLKDNGLKSKISFPHRKPEVVEEIREPVRLPYRPAPPPYQFNNKHFRL